MGLLTGVAGLTGWKMGACSAWLREVWGQARAGRARQARSRFANFDAFASARRNAAVV
jgi:hypothetical protein